MAVLAKHHDVAYRRKKIRARAGRPDVVSNLARACATHALVNLLANRIFTEHPGTEYSPNARRIFLRDFVVLVPLGAVGGAGIVRGVVFTEPTLTSNGRLAAQPFTTCFGTRHHGYTHDPSLPSGGLSCQPSRGVFGVPQSPQSPIIIAPGIAALRKEGRIGNFESMIAFH